MTDLYLTYDLPTPIPFKGAQGFFDVPDGLIAEQFDWRKL